MKISMSVANTEYWDELSASKLSDQEIDLFLEQLNWKIVSSDGDISEISWIKHQKRIDYHQLIFNPNVPASIYDRFALSIDWEMLCECHPLSDDFVLNISFLFETLHAFRGGRNPENVSDETWEKVKVKNSEKFHGLSPSHKKEFLRRQLLSNEAISSNAFWWDDEDWKYISEYHPIDYALVQKHLSNIHTKRMEQLNFEQTLTGDEFYDIRQQISDVIRMKIKHGEEVDWVKLDRQYTFDDDLFHTYKDEIERARMTAHRYV